MVRRRADPCGSLSHATLTAKVLLSLYFCPSAASKGARVDVLIAATERNRETFEAFVDVCQQQQRGFEVREVVDFPVPPRREQCGPFYDDRVPIRICSIVARQ